MSFVGNAFSSVVNFVGDIVETAVDFVGNAVESVVDVLSDPFDDPFKTALTAAAIYTGYNAWTAPATGATIGGGVAGAGAAPGTYAALSGPMFNPALATAATSTATATAGIAAGVAAGGQAFSFVPGATAGWNMTGSSLSLAPNTFAGVGAGSAAGSMAGSVWGVSTPTFMEQAGERIDKITGGFEDIIESPDPVGEVWEKIGDVGEYAAEEIGYKPFLKGVERDMANESLLGAWSPTIGYQAGGDPGSATAQAYPSFTRAETGIFGDPFNLEGRDVGMTVNQLASKLQQQQPTTFPLPAQAGAFRGGGLPAEQQRALMDPNYNASQVQQPMLDALTAQLGAGAQRRGLETTSAGLAAGIAPLMEQFQRNRLADLQAGAGLDLEARGQGVQGRGQDIQALLGQQDVGTAADVARKNITLNSLLALAQMSKPQIVGGTTSFSDTQGATRPDIGFSGQVPVGGIASAGWDLLGKAGSWIDDNWLGDIF